MLLTSDISDNCKYHRELGDVIDKIFEYGPLPELKKKAEQVLCYIRVEYPGRFYEAYNEIYTTVLDVLAEKDLPPIPEHDAFLKALAKIRRDELTPQTIQHCEDLIQGILVEHGPSTYDVYSNVYEHTLNERLRRD